MSQMTKDEIRSLYKAIKNHDTKRVNLILQDVFELPSILKQATPQKSGMNFLEYAYATDAPIEIFTAVLDKSITSNNKTRVFKKSGLVFQSYKVEPFNTIFNDCLGTGKWDHLSALIRHDEKYFSKMLEPAQKNACGISMRSARRNAWHHEIHDGTVHRVENTTSAPNSIKDQIRQAFLNQKQSKIKSLFNEHARYMEKADSCKKAAQKLMDEANSFAEKRQIAMPLSTPHKKP